jgi:hypothetical protein
VDAVDIGGIQVVVGGMVCRFGIGGAISVSLL